jgi:hypothetical protein
VRTLSTFPLTMWSMIPVWTGVLWNEDAPRFKGSVPRLKEG